MTTSKPQEILSQRIPGKSLATFASTSTTTAKSDHIARLWSHKYRGAGVQDVGGRARLRYKKSQSIVKDDPNTLSYGSSRKTMRFTAIICEYSIEWLALRSIYAGILYAGTLLVLATAMSTALGAFILDKAGCDGYENIDRSVETGMIGATVITGLISLATRPSLITVLRMTPSINSEVIMSMIVWSVLNVAGTGEMLDFSQQVAATVVGNHLLRFCYDLLCIGVSELLDRLEQFQDSRYSPPSTSSVAENLRSLTRRPLGSYDAPIPHPNTTPPDSNEAHTITPGVFMPKPISLVQAEKLAALLTTHNTILVPVNIVPLPSATEEDVPRRVVMKT